MSDIEKTLKDIINKNALAEDVLSEFDKPRVDRFRDMLYSYLSKLDTQMYKLFRKSIIILSTVLPILAGLLGYLISKDLIPKDYHLVTWISYLAITIPLIVFARLLPEDSEVLRLEATRIKLANLCERLASKVALFDLLSEYELSEDETFIQVISAFVPEVDQFSVVAKATITKCTDYNFVPNDSRDTNIFLEKLKVDEAMQQRLLDLTSKLVSLSHHMFLGRNFAAKLYLRTKKQWNDRYVDILVSFSKFSPTQQGYGSSWVKCRGNPSTVWQCLESGKFVVRDREGFGSYYDSVLAICLPGRIGVLALTAQHMNAFTENIDDYTVKFLAVAAQQLAFECFQQKSEQ